MSNELIRPIDAETAKAIEEAAKLGSGIVDAAVKGGGYLDRVFGKLPDNLVGVLIGDWLVHKRVRRWVALQADTEAVLQMRGVARPYDEISPSVAIPLIEAAIDEDRDGLKDLWARLLASAHDPERRSLVRPSVIAVLKSLDPLDAKLLSFLKTSHAGRVMESDVTTNIARDISASRDETGVSLAALLRLQLAEAQSTSYYPYLTPMGRLLLAAVSD